MQASTVTTLRSAVTVLFCSVATVVILVVAEGVIFANGAGLLARAALAGGLSGGRGVTQELVAAADWFDFAHFVGVDRRAQPLVQHGRADQTAPIEAGRELFAAAAQPKPWAEYDWDHGRDADPQARRDRAEFVVNGAISSSSTSAEKRSTTPEEPDRSASGRYQRSVIASALDGAHPASLRQTAPRKGPFRSGNHQGRASGFAAA